MAKLIDLIVSGKSSFANDINAKNIYADKFATTGGTTAHVVRGDGTLQTIASLSVGNADTVDSQHANRFPWIYNSANILTSTSVTCNDIAADANSNAHMGMIYSSTNNPTGATKWVHVWSQTWNRGVISSWVSQIALGVQDGTGMWYRTTAGALSSKAWTRVIDSENIGSQSVNYANSAGYSGYAQKLQIHDVRSATRTPNYFEGNRITAWFNNSGVPSSGTWYSGIHVKGWSNGYSSWELCSYSSTGTDNNYDLYFRNGINDSWGSWKTVLTDSNYTTHLDPRYLFHKKYSSLSALPSGSEGWYSIGNISDMSGSACIFIIRAYAHSSAIFTVSKGYSTSGNITVLQYCSSGNGSYAYVKGARLLSDGTVEVSINKPAANNSTYVSISIAMYNADNVKPFDVLTLDSGSPTVIQTKTFTNDAITATSFIGNASSSTIASTVTVNDSNANSTYRMVWHSGNTLYSTGGIYCNPSTDYLYATSMNASDWFRSSGNTGWYNPTNSCHVYPNNLSTYGGLILRGTKGGYHGFLLGDSTSYMNLMDDGTNKGLYQESNGQWILYYHRSNKRVGLLTSSLKSYPITLNGDTYIVGGWLRTEGDTGWYNESYGGGWYMSDTTYIRVHGSKRVYNANTSQYAFYTSGGMTALGHMYSSSSACSWIAGQNATNAALNIADATDTGSYWPWFRQTNTASAKWFSVGTLGNRLYFIGSATSRTANSYDYGFSMDFSNGYLYGNFSGYLSGTASNVTVNDSNADSTYRMVWHSGNTLYSTAGIYCNPSTDAMYATRYYANASAGPHFTGTSAAGNWAYLRLNNSAHIWDIATRSDSASGGLWLSRYAGGDNGIFVTASSTPKVGINTSSPSETLTVAGWVGTTGATGWYNITYAGGIHMSDTTWVRVYNNKKFYVNNSEYNAIHSAGGVYVAGMVHSYANYLKSTNNGKYVMIGPQNGSHAHYETDATTSHWFNKRVDVNGAIWRYGTNYGISSEGYLYAKGVYANRDGSSTGGGVSLYADSDPMTYGIAFRGTGSYGTKGRVQSDWATYLTMSDTTNRGWIFRRGSTNVASVSGEGIAYFEGVGRDTYIAYPGGATYTYGSGNITGALKITLPVKGCSTMMHMKITIYNYSGETSSTYYVAGYNYSDGNWYNCTAYSLRQSANGYGNLTVRFGNDGSKDCIYIGETSTTWSYPNVVVSDVLIGHSSQSHASWAGGWSVTVTTSLGNIKATISNPALNYYSQNAGYASSAGNADTVDGLHAHTQALNNQANKLVRTEGNGYIQTSYIYYGGNEKNSSNPSYVAGFNGSDNYIRSYNTAYLRVSNADMVDDIHANRFAFIYNSANYNASSSLTLNEMAANSNSNAHMGMIHAGTDNPVSTSGNWVHVWSQSWTRGNISSWCSQIALGVQQGTGMWYRTTSGALAGKGWNRVLDSANYTSYVNNYYWANVKISTSSNSATYPTFANMKSTGRVYLDEWIQFSGGTGLYWPNTNGAHLYANTTTSYAGLMTQGARNGYCGLHCGPNTNYMTVMSTDVHHGLYCENTGHWEIYYNRSSGSVGIRSSSITKQVNLTGTTYISDKTWIGTTSGGETLNVGGWVGTTGNTGWYNISYAGGMYMEDTTYVRTYNSKALYVSNSGQHAIYTAGGFASATSNGHVLSTYYSSTWYTSIATHGNGNLSISPPSGSLYLAYNYGNTYFGGGTYFVDRAGNLGSDAVRWNTIWAKMARFGWHETLNASNSVVNVVNDSSQNNNSDGIWGVRVSGVDTSVGYNSYWNGGFRFDDRYTYNSIPETGIMTSVYGKNKTAASFSCSYGESVYISGSHLYYQGSGSTSYGSRLGLYCNAAATFESGVAFYPTTSAGGSHMSGGFSPFVIVNTTTTYTLPASTYLTNGQWVVLAKKNTSSNTYNAGSGTTFCCCWDGGSRSTTSFGHSSRSYMMFYYNTVWYVIRFS